MRRCTTLWNINVRKTDNDRKQAFLTLQTNIVVTIRIWLIKSVQNNCFKNKFLHILCILQTWNWVTFCDPATQWPKNHVTRRPSWPGDPYHWTCIYFCWVSIWHSCAGLLTMCVSLWDWGGLFVFATLRVAPAVWALRHVMRLRWATFSNQYSSITFCNGLRVRRVCSLQSAPFCVNYCDVQRHFELTSRFHV